MSNNVTLPGAGVVVDTIDTSMSGVTNGTTAAANATLHFAVTPANVAVGMVVTDTTAPTVIPSNTSVLSFTGTTVVMSANATGAGVGNGDTIQFAGGERQKVAIAPFDGSNVDIFGVPSQAAVITDAPGTMLQYLRGLVKLIAAGINVVVTNALTAGSALAANSSPTTNAPTSFRVAVTATVTASAYTAGNVLGGILTFANMLLPTPTVSPTKWSAVLQSIAVKFKATVVTGEIDVAIFTASPSGGTYTNHGAPTAAAADQALLVGIYSLPTPMSTLGTMTTYNLDGIGAPIDGASTSLFAVVTVKGTPTPASTTDVIVELGVLQG